MHSKTALLEKCDSLRSEAHNIYFLAKGTIRRDEWIGIYSSSYNFLEKVFTRDHIYINLFPDFSDQSYDSVKIIKKLLENAYNNIEGNWHLSLKQTISSEFFSDFLEMAEHFLDLNYKEPAAVLIGGVLEENLRSLCLLNGIELTEEKGKDKVPKKAERLNQDLGKQGVYSSHVQKAVTGWLDLRNKAAHGKHSEYNINEVIQMLSGIRFFLKELKG